MQLLARPYDGAAKLTGRLFQQRCDASLLELAIANKFEGLDSSTFLHQRLAVGRHGACKESDEPTAGAYPVSKPYLE